MVPWVRRFLREANLMSPKNAFNIEKRVKLETANYKLQDYWETIILEKKQISVKRKHLAGGLDLLYASEKSNAQHILSDEKKDQTPIGHESGPTFTNYDDESDESNVECELRLNVDEIGFDEYIEQGNKYDTLENLRMHVKSNFVRKEKVSRDIKSSLQEYIETALDGDDGGLYKLRETIVSSFSKTFDLTTDGIFLTNAVYISIF
ncbi:19401_t:CDS:2, partial [Dentiscutata erythropus]